MNWTDVKTTSHKVTIHRVQELLPASWASVLPFGQSRTPRSSAKSSHVQPYTGFRMPHTATSFNMLVASDVSRRGYSYPN